MEMEMEMGMGMGMEMEMEYAQPDGMPWLDPTLRAESASPSPVPAKPPPSTTTTTIVPPAIPSALAPRSLRCPSSPPHHLSLNLGVGVRQPEPDGVCVARDVPPVPAVVRVRAVLCPALVLPRSRSRPAGSGIRARADGDHGRPAVHGPGLAQFVRSHLVPGSIALRGALG